MLWLVFAASLSAYALLFKLIKIFDATRVASLFYLGPSVTMLMAWAVYGGTLQHMDVVGLVTAGIGVILAQLQFKNKTIRRKHDHAGKR